MVFPMGTFENMIQRDMDKVQKALTLAQRAFGAAATIASENVRHLPFGSAERRSLFQETVARLTRGQIPRETIEAMERVAAQLRSQRPERWVQGLRGIPPEFRR